MNNKQIQEILISEGLLDPPADGAWGAQSRNALRLFQQRYKLKIADGSLTEETKKLLADTSRPKFTLKLGNDLASRICKTMLAQGMYISHVGYNIVYIEGANADGTPNDDAPDKWNDRRILVQIDSNGVPKIVGNWLCTSEPGKQYTIGSGRNPQGAARIKLGQYKAWQFGIHRGKQFALVQAAPIPVCRDLNKDYSRKGDKVHTGLYGINQHHGWNISLESIQNASAGCLVGRTASEHEQFMRILESDPRAKVNRKYMFMTAIIMASDLK